MPRFTDPKQTRKALRRVRRLAEAQAQTEDSAPAADFSGWEKEFLSEVATRLDTYGSAFADPSKGAPEEALSRLQAQKLREIELKARGKAPKGFRTRPKVKTRPDDSDE